MQSGRLNGFFLTKENHWQTFKGSSSFEKLELSPWQKKRRKHFRIFCVWHLSCTCTYWFKGGRGLEFSRGRFLSTKFRSYTSEAKQTVSKITKIFLAKRNDPAWFGFITLVLILFRLFSEKKSCCLTKSMKVYIKLVNIKVPSLVASHWTLLSFDIYLYPVTTDEKGLNCCLCTFPYYM
jgi:hypothetical protein